VIAIKVSGLLVLALATAAGLRARSAALRHAVLASAIACAAAMPVLETVVPSWLVRSSMDDLTAPAPFDRRWLIGIWIAGAVFSLATLVVGLVRLQWIASRARRVADGGWMEILETTATDHGIACPVLLQSDHPTLLATWGFWRPEVILPRPAAGWTADRIRIVLAHELAHVRRRDWAVQMMAEWLRAVHWFNPIVWLACRQMRQHSEQACDDAVLACGVKATTYASELVAVARALRVPPTMWAPAPGMARLGMLEGRITATLNTSASRAPVTPRLVMVTLTTFLAVAAPIAGWRAPARVASAAARDSSLDDLQRGMMMRLGGVEKRFSFASSDASFRNIRMEGRVELRARLAVDGSLAGLRVIEPAHPALAQAAEAMVRQWRPDPVRLRGVPVEVPVRLTVDFRGGR